ncbi:hypothetical protein KKJ06_20420 [Xenorhabdus bovienii]|uniref:hypothetical protein n=1 Tax=Xenorhabdus bovienii TaxID=40576 RepID=UPI0023B20DCA|nr:hypothetical protein [Xenorhabdus bovienii]MDE9557717.1 hypothetical protein [Xenorhabdus bovienii]
MDIKRQNELLNFYLGGIVQIDKADGMLKPRESTSQAIEKMIKQLDKNTELYVLLTLEEAVDAVKNLCGPNPNASWKDGLFSCSDIATSFTGSIIDAYGALKLANELSSNFGVKVKEYIDKHGNRNIKLTGRTGVRNFLTAAKYGVNHWKMIEMGIGSQGMQSGIITGARYCIFVSAAYRSLELLFRDEYDVHSFFGNISMDVAKTAVGFFAGMGAKAVVGTFLTAGTYALAVSVGIFLVGFGVAIILYHLDNKYEISKKLINFMREDAIRYAERNRVNYGPHPDKVFSELGRAWRG